LFYCMSWRSSLGIQKLLLKNGTGHPSRKICLLSSSSSHPSIQQIYRTSFMG
jgi:hypothetical protein